MKEPERIERIADESGVACRSASEVARLTIDAAAAAAPVAAVYLHHKLSGSSDEPPPPQVELPLGVERPD